MEKCTDHEGIQIVEAFRPMGYHTFIVDYRCGMNAYPYPAPQEDAIRAMRIVRGNASKWHVNANRIAAIGFSAGGHLCASLGVWHDKIQADAGDEFDSIPARPDAVILCYPVISASCTHLGSFLNLMNAKECPPFNDMKKYSCEEYVTPDSPPAFIWTTAADQIVPADNSFRYAQACQKNGVPYALHIYPFGPHGLAAGTMEEFAEIKTWLPLCRDFLNVVWNRQEGAHASS